MHWNSDLRAWIEGRAHAAGFALAGLASVLAPDTPEAIEDHRRFSAWLAAGHAGEMHWLERTDGAGNLLRGGLRTAFPWAQSVLVCALNYNAAAPRSTDPAPLAAGWIARYAWSGAAERPTDYHDTILTRLRTLEADIVARFGPDCQTRSYVDTGPIVERGFAQRAGIGWTGKNTCTLNQQQGSWLLLGVIVTSVPLAAGEWTVPAADRCGTCTRCLDACPTGALIAPRQMDASRCIAYLTIEKKGSIPEDLREGIGRNIFGCDICQDVCPWNRDAPIAVHENWPTRPALVNPPLAEFAAMDSAAFRRLFKGSPLERTGRKRLLRNVAIAMGNSGEQELMPQLEAWSTSDDPILAESARWALKKLDSTHSTRSSKLTA